MYSRSLRWFLVGAATAVVLAAAGAVVVALRRGCALADGEDELFPPTDESVDPVSPVGAIG
jgi:hypothetical protein